jgi:hypothetical protein
MGSGNIWSLSQFVTTFDLLYDYCEKCITLSTAKFLSSAEKLSGSVKKVEMCWKNVRDSLSLGHNIDQYFDVI